MWLQNIPKFLKWILSEGRESGNTPLDFLYIANSYTASQVLFLTSLLLKVIFPPEVNSGSTYIVCAHFKQHFWELDACKWSTVPFPDCYLHFLCYHTTNSKKLWWWSGNEAVMVAWEWGCDGGLGIRLWLWSGNKAVMVVWKWGCDGGLGLKQELLVTTVRVYIKKCTLAHPVLWTNGNINTS